MKKDNGQDAGRAADRDFLEMVLQERLAMHLSRITVKESGESKEAEEIISGLELEQREKVLAFLDETYSIEAEREYAAYKGGLEDGLKLAALFRDGLNGAWKKWLPD